MMSSGSPALFHRRLAIGLALMTFLIAAYLMTYNGYAISGDEWYLFDATESIARRGTLEQNLQYDVLLPETLAEAQSPAVDSEPLQPLLAASLFLAAQALPGIGLAHTVWIFNILITALTAGTLYLYSLALGYPVRIAAPVALIFGLGTIAWPYSRTFFREPLFTWLALLSLYAVRMLRQRLEANIRPLGALLLLALAVSGALLSKEAALLFIPVLVVEAIPARVGLRHLSRRMILSLLALSLFAVALGIVILNLETWFGVSITRYAISSRLNAARRNLTEISVGVTGYLFSPARSIWLFSPVLILGIFGWPRLVRQRQWRQLAVPGIMLVSFVGGYAAVRGPDTWYGGLGWGARYMVPVTPFLALWLLPVFESLWEATARWWQRTTAALVVTFSIGVQIFAALVPVQSYYDTLNAVQPSIISWQEGAWSWRWSPWRIYLDLIGDVTPDIAWRHAVGPSWLLPVLAVLLAVLSAGWLIAWRHPASAPASRSLLSTAGSLALGTVLALGLSLYAIREDPRYSGNFKPLRDLLAQLEANVRPNDVIVLNDFTYQNFFMNYYKLSAPILYTLPASPGERSNPDQPAQVESPDPNDLILPTHTLSLNYLAGQYDRLWLIMNSSRFVTFAVRPVEQYLSRHYFPVLELAPSDLARAVLFDTTPAPLAPAPLWPEHLLNADFGTSLQLVGWDTPSDQPVSPGSVVPVSLLWEARAPVAQDYTVAVFVMNNGQIIAQRDSYPANYFDPTQGWRTGSLHRDNHGLLLPESIPPGDYEIWVVLYHWQTPNERLPVTSTDGASAGDHVVLGTFTVR